MIQTAQFYFHGHLLPLVSAAGPDGMVDYHFGGAPAIKDALEALGVPHTEIDLLIVDGCSVGFDFRLRTRQLVQVFPFGMTPNLKLLRHLSPALPQNPAFILDVHLGKLARRLRMLGFDCRYRNDFSDSRIIELALVEDLIILTRDRGILKHARVQQGYLIRACQAEEQVNEVLERYRLHTRIQPLCRCPLCNGLLEQVDKEKVRSRLLAKTARYYDQFQRCMDCERLYWQGSHYAKISRWVESLRTRG